MRSTDFVIWMSVQHVEQVWTETLRGGETVAITACLMVRVRERPGICCGKLNCHTFGARNLEQHYKWNNKMLLKCI